VIALNSTGHSRLSNMKNKSNPTLTTKRITFLAEFW